jgi:cell division protein FtsZ
MVQNLHRNYYQYFNLPKRKSTMIETFPTNSFNRQYKPQPASPDAPTQPTLVNVHKPVLKVLGLGGGVSNAVNRMIELGLAGVEFITANTDHQALQNSLAPIKIHLGPKTTRGLGAGGNPAIGQAAAEESWREIAQALKGADMVFLTAGMGGGTGTGSVPVAAKIARSLGAVTIAVVTTPFSFEMGRRQRNAMEGLARLRPITNTLITIPNDRLLYLETRNLPLDMAFRMADDILRQGVQGITELVTTPGMINVDFANIRHLMTLGGGALMSIGQGEGENKAIKAIEQALHHPLLDSASLDHAAGVLVNFTAGDDLSLFEIEAALTNLQNQAGSQAEIVMGVVNDERFYDRVEVILVVTGLGATSIEETLPGFSTASAKKPASEAQARSSQDSEPEPRRIVQETISAPASNDLDVPAFLRRAR